MHLYLKSSVAALQFVNSLSVIPLYMEGEIISEIKKKDWIQRLEHG